MPDPAEMVLWRFWFYCKLAGVVFGIGYLLDLVGWELGAVVFFLPELTMGLVLAWWMAFLTWRRWFGRPS